jgi:hypothetical protein
MVRKLPATTENCQDLQLYGNTEVTLHPSLFLSLWSYCSCSWFGVRLSISGENECGTIDFFVCILHLWCFFEEFELYSTKKAIAQIQRVLNQDETPEKINSVRRSCYNEKIKGNVTSRM